MHDLVADGNSVVVVDHDVRVLKAADHLIEMGPVAGAEGGHVIAQGTVGEVAANPSSRIAPFLADNVSARIRERVAEPQVFDLGRIRMTTSQLHTVKPLDVDIPRGRLVAVTGVSGSGKTTMVLESLIPALKAQAAGERLPEHVRELEPRASIVRISSTPRRLAQTYAHRGHLCRYSRRIAPRLRPHGRRQGGRLEGWRFLIQHRPTALPHMRRTGSISLDVQFLPDVTIECPDCGAPAMRPKPTRFGVRLKRLKASGEDERSGINAKLPRKN